MGSIEKFLKKVFKTNHCWFWIGATDKDGYGITNDNYKNIRAHRKAFEIFKKKKIPKGKLICHKCDIPSCVNPNHLFLGTATTNNQDTVKKGRHVQFCSLRKSCAKGHLYSVETIYFDKKANKRVCKICRRKYDKKRYLKNLRIKQ